jgi:UDP-N-acetylmuramate-alanine ligase
VDILILDALHGGEVLAEIMARRGHSVICADIYGKASEATMMQISAGGASAVTAVPKRHFDIVMAPVHCPDSFLEGVTWNEKITFHEAVGRLIGDGDFRIEVTGVKGKTSTCCIIAHVLSVSGVRVMLHTSRAYGPWEDGRHLEDGKMSIAPTSLLRIPQGYDASVCEVSLGGSGKADIAVITNIADDYAIAAGTRKASEAKASILCSGINIVPRRESRSWERYGKEIIRYGGRIRIIRVNGLGEEIEAELHYGGIRKISFGKGYLALQYLDSMEAALEVFHAMGVPADIVIKGLGSFRGVPGRGEIRMEGGVTRVKERNPGISHVSVDHVLRCIREYGFGGRMLAILDPVSRKICDTLDTIKVIEAADRYGVPVISAGEPYVPEEHDVIVEFIKEGYQ